MDERAPNDRQPAAGRAAAFHCAWFLGLAASAAACMARFQPTLPMRAVSGDIELTVRDVRVGGLQEITLDSRSTTPHTIHRGRFTVATRAPCTGGEEAAWIEVDRGTVPPNTLPPGAHELRVRFERSADDFALDLVFDLDLEDGACARVPVVSQSVPMEPTKRFVLVGSFDAAATPDLSGLRGLISGRIGGGGWLGPVLLTAEAGIGSATCVASLCGRDAMGKFNSGLSIPGAIDVRYAVGARNVNRLLSVFLLGARYTFATVNLPTLTEGERSFVTHSAHAIASMGIGDAARGPFRKLERVALLEAMLLAGIVAAPGAPQERLGFSGGMALRFVLPM